MAVRITGLQETVRAFNKLDRAVSREIQRELKKAAEPVETAGREKISRYAGASVGTIRPRAAGSSVWITQKARKVTGLRPDYGFLQQRRLDEALNENEDKVEANLEDFLDRLTRSAGF
jgi:hypothetical protein